MDANGFVRKWAASKRSERAASQEHFIDLCGLLHEQTPNTDPSGDYYAFEKGAKTPDGDGFADVWQRGHFAWEYKGKHHDLTAAYAQVQRYREALENPPLLIVCDLDRYEVHTNWTNTEVWVYRFHNADIATDAHVEVTTASGPAEDAPEMTALQVLKALFEDPERLKPHKTRDEITQKAARLFGNIATVLRDWKVDETRIARFVTKTMFCMFATDVGLLPKETFSEVVRVHRESGDAGRFRRYVSELFTAMNSGGEFQMRKVPYFDGRLFEDSDVPEAITAQEIFMLEQLDKLNWADVEPAIFGTLFERVLDPKQRKMLGAHYTSRDDIELIVRPVLMDPLEKRWAEVQAEVGRYLDEAATKRTGAGKQHERVAQTIAAFHNELATIRILDPACGSGNFLYVALALLKELENHVIAFASLYGVELQPRVHPRQLHGIETNEYAHELASIVIWIGYLQWKHRNMIPFADESPILQPLDQVEGKDAIVDLTDSKRPREATWPEVDVIVGNPPFLGGKRLRTELGDAYVDKLFAVYDGRVARESDLCCYWFERGREAIEQGRAKRVGLLATQAIRGGANRRVLERVKETGDIFYAQADRRWIQEGVAVRVSMVGFDDGSETRRLINEDTDDDARVALLRARPVEGINANLTYQTDVTKARRLKENIGISFMGDTKVGPFELPARGARDMLAKPNPHGKPNSDVVRPWVNGLDITRRPRDMWIVDFPPGTTEKAAALYEAPFAYVERNVKPFRAVAKSGDATGVAWWIHQRPRPDMRGALAGKNRYLATPNLTKYRFFVWLGSEVLPDHQLIVFARSDDYFFGVLQSSAHEVWARSTGTQLRESESGFRYTPTTCFDTFPFPHGTQELQWAISLAAKDLDEHRNAWLNPERGEIEIGVKELNKRTLTNLYNERQTWLENDHRALDEAVFAAYGWRERPEELADAEIIARLLKLNLEREAAG